MTVMDNECPEQQDSPKDPQDALRMNAFTILSRLQSGTEEVVRLDVALAALDAERKRWQSIAENSNAAVREAMGGADKNQEACRLARECRMRCEALEDWQKFSADVIASCAAGVEWLDELRNRTAELLSPNHSR